MFEWLKRLFCRRKYKTKIYIKKVHPDAVIPTQRKGDIGWDVSSVELKVLMPRHVTIVDTGLQFARDPVIENGKWAIETKVESRSGLASQGVFVVGGELDPSYRGNFLVCLFNSTTETYTVNKGDRIAQLLLRPVLAITNSHNVSFQETEEQQKTKRGTDGLGSTGR